MLGKAGMTAPVGAASHPRRPCMSQRATRHSFSCMPWRALPMGSSTCIYTSANKAAHVYTEAAKTAAGVREHYCAEKPQTVCVIVVTRVETGVYARAEAFRQRRRHRAARVNRPVAAHRAAGAHRQRHLHVDRARRGLALRQHPGPFRRWHIPRAGMRPADLLESSTQVKSCVGHDNVAVSCSSATFTDRGRRHSPCRC